jgi:hypothetical protein
MLLIENQCLQELRAAAFHEAGHKVMCHRFCGAGYAEVWRNPSGNPDELLWGGQFCMVMSPQLRYEMSKANGALIPEPPVNCRVLIGMAGLIAEELQRGETDDPGLIAESVEHRIWSGGASATDLTAMGIEDTDSVELSFDDVEHAVRVLIEDWALVQKEAEYLIEGALNSAGGSALKAMQQNPGQNPRQL